MNHEVALFWVLVVGFLAADNLLLIPHGGDFLRFGRTGAFIYEPRTRLEIRGCDLLFLNPLNLFHRAAITSSSIGPITASQFRIARRRIRSALPSLNAFAWVGYVYLFAVVLLAAASLRSSFSLVLLTFLACHAVFWLVTTSMLLAWRHSLSLSKYQTFVHAAEALFVPAYAINMGKRLWFKQTLDLPALTLGLRQLRTIRDESARELYVYELRMRLDDLEFELDASDPDDTIAANDHSDERAHRQETRVGSGEPRRMLKEARACLTI